MGASDALENQIITRLIDGNSYLVSPDATYYMSLHATDPGDTGTGELASVNGYARKSYTTSGGWNAAALGSTSNSGSITFAAASGGDWAAAYYFGIWNSAAGTSANFILSGALTGSPIVCTDGDAVQFLGGTPGALVITVT
tara:strand:- start:14 stop:436 length:423 start_codon:yes stop_codon:yes gene_type:complete